jgi:DNA polymerase-3 subunit chi
MPQVEFRTGVPDKLAYAVRWLRLAAARGARTRVIGAGADLAALDRALWVADAGDFLPHMLLRAGPLPPGCERTPIWLGDGAIPGPSPSLLLNIGADPPAELEGLERIIEVIGRDDDDVRAGRRRWQIYRERSLEPRHRDEGTGSVQN